MKAKQKTFNDIQNEYNELFKSESVRDEDRAYRWFARILLEPKNSPKSLLDLACGGGYFMREVKNVSKSSVKLTGIDISQTAIEIAKRECPDADYHLGVAEELPFEDKRFDALTCLGSMEHFLDIPKAIKEMIRVTKNDGRIYILVPNQFWYKDIWYVWTTGDKKHRNQTQERFCTKKEWMEILEDAGLSIEEVRKYNGIAKYGWKQFLKDILIPKNLSYHFLFICQAK